MPAGVGVPTPEPPLALGSHPGSAPAATELLPETDEDDDEGGG